MTKAAAKIRANTSCFGMKVTITRSGEEGVITGHASYVRNKQAQFFVEYKAADGRAVSDWFFQDQITETA